MLLTQRCWRVHNLNPLSKLAQAIHQRWGSLVKSLISFIERYDSLQSSYQKRRQFWNINTEESTAIIEIISVLSPIRDIIFLAQSRSSGLVPQIVEMLTDLRAETLNEEKPLLIIDPWINLENKTRKIKRKK